MKTIGNLTGLAWALAELAEKPQAPDEFTAKEYCASSGAASLDGVRAMLYRLEREQKLTSRLVTINSKRTRLYRRA